MASKLEPEDFSRFFIREFLKKNNFNKAYASFMEEDKRPPVAGTMNRAVLTELLGLESLNKKNTKTKKFTTMLDMLMNYLQQVKEKLGGVTLPEEKSAAKAVKKHVEEKLSFYGGGPAPQDSMTRTDNSSGFNKMKPTPPPKNVNAYGSGSASI